MEVEYRTRLTTVLDVTRFLLKQGLPFHGHDEPLSSLNKGNFLELLEWYSLWNDKIFRAITCAIVDDIGDKCFSLMIDEARDVSVKEQMGVVLRYANKNGYVIERFLAMVHVLDTSSISLKNATDCLFAKHGLSLSRLRGQGYDGASNMYIYCFAHQLQLVVVAVAKDNRIVSDFFQYVTMIANVAGASCKRKDQLRQHHHDRLVEQLEKVDIVSGRGKNQESSLARPVLDVLQHVHDDGASNDNRGIAVIDLIAQEMQNRFPETSTELLLLLLCLDPKDSFSKFNIHKLLRLTELYPEDFTMIERMMLEDQLATFIYHVIDLISQEMLNRFPEASTKLLLLVSCLDPRDSFSKFNIHKLLRLAELYLEDFSLTERMMLEDQLATFIYDVRHDDDFANIGDLRGFAIKMVDTGKCTIFPLVYRLVELALVLPVATASVEKAFSAMNIVKTDLRNKMGVEWMNDSMIVYIEKEVFATSDNEAIL
ncbi:zinc finger MYM-type protein 1-like [Dioscorea cayenensis subsp. rotundata]|uniref:Zinc finger MYM-type protein 1-like n=1 Tax=Dioscorea cayennensis subsp. rotundata TaxID=55577 RepID=A0AB40B3C8_DIOCR|nr:zinc finger MYM-type protein 1-like [Dioscorea cayenensis subsp. rotundata]